MARHREISSLLSPRYWPTWLGIGLFRLLVYLPWPVQFRLGRLFGWLGFHLIRFRRNIILTNLRLCFPEKTEREQLALALAHYQALAIGVFETCYAWWRLNPKDMLPVEITGLEHLHDAAAKQRGVILLTAHFTTIELCGRFLSERLPMGCLFRYPDNPVIARQMYLRRLLRMSIAIPMEDMRGLIRALKKGHTIWYAPDQAKKTKFSTVLPFFGVPALTNTATSRITAITGSPVVPYFTRRKPDGSYLLEIQPALEQFPTDDPEADSIRINQLTEEAILRAPEQYFWIHRRFKRRGPEYPEVYKDP